MAHRLLFALHLLLTSGHWVSFGDAAHVGILEVVTEAVVKGWSSSAARWDHLSIEVRVGLSVVRVEPSSVGVATSSLTSLPVLLMILRLLRVFTLLLLLLLLLHFSPLLSLLLDVSDPGVPDVS